MAAQSQGQLMAQGQLNPGHHHDHHLSPECRILVAQELAVLLHKVQGTEVMEYLDTHCPFLLSRHSFCNWGNHTKVTVGNVICWFLPNHRDCKGHKIDFLLEPLAKINCTCVTTIMWSSTFVLISNFATKVMVVCLLNHYSYVALL